MDGTSFATNWKSRHDILLLTDCCPMPGDPAEFFSRSGFWMGLKRALVHRCRFATRADARASIFEWIEVLYNGAVPQRP
jgi:hypothetical protein